MPKYRDEVDFINKIIPIRIITLATPTSKSYRLFSLLNVFVLANHLVHREHSMKLLLEHFFMVKHGTISNATVSYFKYSASPWTQVTVGSKI